MPNAKKWELKSMDKNDIPQQENVSDCGVFICMFCDYILNGCKLNFKQDDIMEGSWRQKMILSILTTCGDNDNDTYKEVMEYESDNDMEVIIQPTKKTKGKRNEIIDELIWTQATKVIAKRIQNSAGKQCKENSDCYVECDDDCTSGEQCTNKRIQNKMWKSVVKKMTENGKEYGLFVKEDCKIGDLIIEYVGKVVQTEKNNQQHILHENKWSTDMDQRNKHGSIGKVHQSLMRPKLQTRTVGSQRITKNVLFCKQRNQGGSRTDL
jgi:hypothetical protein